MSFLAEYYARAARYDTVGACIVNDDWGFKTQTMFSPRDMRKYVFPWHKQIAATIHAARLTATCSMPLTKRMRVMMGIGKWGAGL